MVPEKCWSDLASLNPEIRSRNRGEGGRKAEKATAELKKGETHGKMALCQRWGRNCWCRPLIVEGLSRILYRLLAAIPDQSNARFVIFQLTYDIKPTWVQWHLEHFFTLCQICQTRPKLVYGRRDLAGGILGPEYSSSGYTVYCIWQDLFRDSPLGHIWCAQIQPNTVFLPHIWKRQIWSTGETEKNLQNAVQTRSQIWLFWDRLLPNHLINSCSVG